MGLIDYLAEWAGSNAVQHLSVWPQLTIILCAIVRVVFQQIWSIDHTVGRLGFSVFTRAGGLSELLDECEDTRW